MSLPMSRSGERSRIGAEDPSRTRFFFDSSTTDPKASTNLARSAGPQACGIPSGALCASRSNTQSSSINDLAPSSDKNGPKVCCSSLGDHDRIDPAGPLIFASFMRSSSRTFPIIPARISSSTPPSSSWILQQSHPCNELTFIFCRSTGCVRIVDPGRASSSLACL